jgi:hypothetical protein
MTRKAYIGDGVYVWIYTSNGIEESIKIALEPEVLANLNNFVIQQREAKRE